MRSSGAQPRPRPPVRRSTTSTSSPSDFWYHALWTAKKLRRGEVFTALECLDGHMKARLVTLLGWHARSLDASVDTWHEGRFVERWADPGALAALEKAFAYYDVRDVARALWETIDLWQGLEEETASRLGFELVLDHADLRGAWPRSCPILATPLRSGREARARRRRARRPRAPAAQARRADVDRYDTTASTTADRLRPCLLLRDGKVWPVPRDIEDAGDAASELAAELFAGRRSDERELGFTTALPDDSSCPRSSIDGRS